MPALLNGKSIVYEVLECVARGQESIVYKAQVQSTKRCVALKFRLKDSIVKFRTKELPIFQELDHLNIIKIFDYVEDLGSLRLEGEIEGKSFLIDRTRYFCVVEDFVTGEKLNNNVSSSLWNYCKQRSPKREATYDEIISFQEDYIFKWIFEFCDIMSHMTKEHRILHLDIKPENIMVTTTGSIVLIDMGLSGFLEKQSSGMDLQYDFSHVNKKTKNIERKYVILGDEKVLCFVYGTPGFAAPECYYKDGEDAENDEQLKNPFYSGRAQSTDGIVDVRSDIFSFGCTLWDVIHLGGYGMDPKHKDYVTIDSKEKRDGYFRRDLHYASPYYTQELENIILKCTEEDPSLRFQDYDELKKAAIKAKKRLPKSEENNKKTKMIRRTLMISILISIFLSLIYVRGLELGYEIAEEDFNGTVLRYSENMNPIDFRDVSIHLLEEAKAANVNTDSIYKDVLDTVSNDGRVTSTEFSEIMYKCLVSEEKSIDDSSTIMYVNSAMKIPAEGNDITTISKFIDTNYKGAECEGYYIAQAIANSKTNPLASYKILVSYQDLSEYKLSLNYLSRMLLNEEDISNNLEYREVTSVIRAKTEE